MPILRPIQRTSSTPQVIAAIAHHQVCGLVMRQEHFEQASRSDFATLLSRPARHLLERMAREIENDEAQSALGRLLTDAIAGGRSAEAEAIHTAMHWAPAVAAGNTTEAELVSRLDRIISPELMAAAVASYREILYTVVRRWANAIANGCANEMAVVEQLGAPPDLVSAAVTEYKRACGKLGSELINYGAQAP